jgi:proton glutamate symport protein
MFIIIRWVGIAGLIAVAARKRSLSLWILVGILAGAEFGHDVPQIAVKMQLLATIFLRLIKLIIAPLLLSTLIVGVAGHDDLRKVGRLAVKALIYFEIVSTVAILIGFFVGKLAHVGAGVGNAETLAALPATAMPSVSDLILNIFPENIAKAIADEQVLQIVVFGMLFAVSLALLSEAKRRPIVQLADSVSQTMIQFTNIVMLAAPLGVFGAMASTVGNMGLSVFLPLLKLVAVLYAAIAGFILLVLLPFALAMRIPIAPFLRAVAEPVTIAFATASSEAALPRAMEKMEAIGVEGQTVSFVLATGYSFNLAGSSIYEALAIVFVLQMAHLQLSMSQQVLILLALLVSSKGTAGVARASLVIVLGVVNSFHLPMKPVVLLFGIDQLMDMGRTALNVLGNCLATVLIARSENEADLFSVQQLPLKQEG